MNLYTPDIQIAAANVSYSRLSAQTGHKKYKYFAEAIEMLFAVRFQDHLEQHETRHRYLKAHIEWLDQNADCVLVGGSLRISPDEMPVGGLWIVRAKTKEAVELLIETDPFWVQGLRSSVEILYWSKAFEDREVPV